jgi:predicted cupin superfamily sugar epimerase
MSELESIDLRDPALTGPRIRQSLALSAHPEGGWYRETLRDMPAGEESALHRVDALA